MVGGARREMWVALSVRTFIPSSAETHQVVQNCGHIEKAIFPGKRKTQNMHKCSQDALEQNNHFVCCMLLYTVRLGSCHTACGHDGGISASRGSSWNYPIISKFPIQIPQYL